MTAVAEFQVDFNKFIESDGKPVAALPDFAEDREVMTRLYRWMVLTRRFDARAIALQRTGRLGTFASTAGQEAVGVGVADAMLPEDVLLPSFREHGAQLVRGVTMKEILLYWGGDERGSDFAGPRQDFPVCIPVGTQVPHAVGVALAFKLRNEKRVAVAIFGDGATSKGDVYEAMNVAGAWNLPVVFVANNNEWAISVPREAQTASKTLAQKAIAAGFGGLQVDGNDIVAVRDATDTALEKARAGGGPALIEALTYRLGDHTTVDDASRYRDDEEVGQRWKQEPIARTRAFLADRHGWSREEEQALIGQCASEVDAAAEAYLGEPPEGPEALFDWLYEELPTSYARQRAELLSQK